jgi:phosphoribosylformylglycinamidine synthase
MILEFYGSNPFSDFRLEKILNKARQHTADIENISAIYLYLVDVSAELSIQEQTILEELLDPINPSLKNNTQKFQVIITPRLGTVSPWASKATDIAHICGLNKVKRIERAIVYTLNLSASLS